MQVHRTHSFIMESNEGVINADSAADSGTAVTTADKHNESTVTNGAPPDNVIMGEDKASESKHSLDKSDSRASQGSITADAQLGVRKKSVRFSICEYITETLVQENWASGAHENPAFENEKGMGNGNGNSDGDPGGNRGRYIAGKLRRDSIHPLVGPVQENEKPERSWEKYSPEDDYNEEESEEPWSELSTKRKVLRVLNALGKVLALMALLYFFVCSLDILSLGFRLVGGRTAGEIFRQSRILQNPIVGVMIGILTTVLVQSSSTSTSIIVGMVAAGFMDVRIAIPPIMGANIGTSITNTIVSFTQAGDRNQFRRAFAGATILDMFNWITVMVLLPIEVITGYLYHVSKATVDLIIPDSQTGGEVQVLSVITRPFVDLIVQLNDTVLECWATPNCTEADGASLIKEFCATAKTEIYVVGRVVDVNGKEVLNINEVVRQDDLRRCDFLFANTSMSDAAVGAIILVASLLVLCFCLVMIVKLLSSVLEGHVSNIIKRTLNADIPYVPWITGYIAILIGALMTFLVQSSSVFTSALTPLVGLGVISLNRVYPLTLGANIGTTTTALLASMAADGKSLHPSLQIALCHFFFNITGVLLFYPIPFLRFPIRMAKLLGNITAKYRWFAIFYLVSMFAVLPAVFILLSLAGSVYVIVLISIIGVIVFIVALLTLLQRKLPRILPEILRDWKFLPRPLRSLKPYDNLVSKMPCCSKRSGDEDNDDSDDDSDRPNVYRDSNFVFLTGNKIPPPKGYTADDQKQLSRLSITRIVPTRVIRNISNGNGDYPTGNTIDSIPPITDHTPVQNSVSLTNETCDKQPKNVSPKISSEDNGVDSVAESSSLESNTLPLPRFIEESPSIKQSQDHKRNGSSSERNPSPAFNLAYNNSLESFHV